MSETTENYQNRKEKLIATIKASQAGYGGMMPNGMIVDRREFPEAMVVPKNMGVFGIPEPKKIGNPVEISPRFKAIIENECANQCNACKEFFNSITYEDGKTFISGVVIEKHIDHYRQLKKS